MTLQHQGKLEIYLPTATDSVLCDYVLVMVGNKKTRCQIANDLEVTGFVNYSVWFLRIKIDSGLIRATKSGISWRSREQGIFFLAMGVAQMCGD